MKSFVTVLLLVSSFSGWSKVSCTAKCLVYEMHGTILHDSPLRESGEDAQSVLTKMKKDCSAQKPTRSLSEVVNSYGDIEGELAFMKKSSAANLSCWKVRPGSK